MVEVRYAAASSLYIFIFSRIDVIKLSTVACNYRIWSSSNVDGGSLDLTEVCVVMLAGGRDPLRSATQQLISCSTESGMGERCDTLS